MESHVCHNVQKPIGSKVSGDLPLSLPILPQNTEITETRYKAWLCMGSEALNSGLHTCVATSTLATERSFLINLSIMCIDDFVYQNFANLVHMAENGIEHPKH